MLPIFAESYHDLKKTNKVLEDLLKAAPFFDKEIAPKGILEHIRAACNRVFVSGFAAKVEKVYTGMEAVITKILKYTDKTVPEWQFRLWKRTLEKQVVIFLPYVFYCHKMPCCHK